jgi:hypothetical protein
LTFIALLFAREWMENLENSLGVSMVAIETLQIQLRAEYGPQRVQFEFLP